MIVGPYRIEFTPANRALLTRRSAFTDVERTLNLPITSEEWANWLAGGTLIQHAFPHLSDDEREFVLTGVTAHEWDAEFGKEA